MSEEIRNRVPVSVSIPLNLLLKIDFLAREQNFSRSNYIVKLLEQNIKQ